MATQIISLPYNWSSALADKVDPSTAAIPLVESDLANLKVLLGSDRHSYLTIRGPAGVEVVRVRHEAGLLAWERGLDGTGAQAFPKGARVCVETVPALVKDLVCAFDCCEGDCDCIPAAVAGKTYKPSIAVNEAWSAVIVFSGDMPMSVATSAAPSWMTVTVGPNYAHLSGTPAAAGSYTVAVSATNCGGHVISDIISLVVA